MTIGRQDISSSSVACLVAASALASNLVSPSIHLGVSINIISLVSLPLFIFLLVFPQIQRLRVRLSSSVIAIYLLFVLSTVVSAIAAFARGGNIVFSDLLEIYKYIQFLPYLMISLLFPLKFLHSANKTLLICGTLLCILCTAYLLLPGASSVLASIYSGVNHIDKSDNRPSFTGTDPNLGCIILWFYSLYFASRSALCASKTMRFCSVLQSALLLYCATLTGSRTGIVSIATSLIVLVSIHSRKLSALNRIIFAIAGLSVVSLLVVLSFQHEYVSVGYDLALQGQNSSVNVRLDRFNEMQDAFSISPLLGTGPSKDEGITIFDSEYILLITRYGLIGTFLFVALFLSTFSKAYQVSMLSDLDDMVLILSAFSCAALVGGIIAMTTNNFVVSYQASAAPCILACIALASSRYISLHRDGS